MNRLDNYGSKFNNLVRMVIGRGLIGCLLSFGQCGRLGKGQRPCMEVQECPGRPVGTCVYCARFAKGTYGYSSSGFLLQVLQVDIDQTELMATAFGLELEPRHCCSA
eukprot:1032915-Amphidinium_carterae.1